MTRKVILHEVGLRDGLQMEKQVVPLEQKDAWIRGAAGGRAWTSSRSARSSTRRRCRRWRTPTSCSARLDAGQDRRRRALGPGAEREGPGARPGLRRRDVLHGRLGQRDPQPEEHRHEHRRGHAAHHRDGAAGASAAGKKVQVSVQSAFGCGFEGPVPAERVLGMVRAVPRGGAAQHQPRRHRRPRRPGAGRAALRRGARRSTRRSSAPAISTTPTASAWPTATPPCARA